MKTILFAFLLTTCIHGFAQPSGSETPPSSPAVDKSVDDTINRIRGEKIKALESYLGGNPKAKDGDEVLTELIAQYGELAAHYQTVVARDKKSDDENRRLDALEMQYSYMAKRATVEIKSVSDNIVERFFIVWKGAQSTPEDLKRAQAIFDQGRKDFPKLNDDPWFCRQESKLKRPLVGDALAIAFTALDGRKVDIAALKGKVVVVYFWASSVPDDYKFQPALKATYQRFHDAGLEVIGVSLDDDEAALRAFIKKEKIPWPQAFDGKASNTALVEKYGVVTIPFYFVVGRDGKVADYSSEGSELEAKIAELLK